MVSDVLDRGVQPDGLGVVYLTPERDCAWHYAYLAADEHAERPVILRVEMPHVAHLEVDALGPYTSVCQHGPIRPEWIKAVECA